MSSPSSSSSAAAAGLDRSLSSLSLSSSQFESEDDWDRSLPDPSLSSLDLTVDADQAASAAQAYTSVSAPVSATTPRNSVVFPATPTHAHTPSRRSRYSSTHSRGPSLDKAGKKRTLSELLRMHSEKGSSGRVSNEEAARIADVLGQWINASSSPYEPPEDDFFSPAHAQDDISIASKRPIPVHVHAALRPRGRSESATSPLTPVNGSAGSNAGSRPPSSVGFVAAS